jgi:flagellar hook-associated protein 3 FlgL
MRVSTSQIYQQGVGAILDNQSTLAKTQLQLATGRRILVPSDDPVASAEAVGLDRLHAATAQYQRNAGEARDRLAREESGLTSVTDLLQRVRELAVQANNDSQTGETRRYIAIEIRERLGELLGLANTRDANNEYLFAGYRGSVQPFSSTASGAYAYSGDPGARFVQIGPNQQVAAGDPGSDVFMAIHNGNGTFATLDNPANSGTGVIDPGTVSGAFVRDTYTISFSQPVPGGPITYGVTGVTSGVVVAAGTPYVEGAEIVFNGVKTNITGTPANLDSFTVSPSVNQDLFSTVQNLALALETPGTAGANNTGLHNAVNRFLTDVDQGMENIHGVRARIGARVNTIDSQTGTNDDFALQLEQSLSELRDLDYAEAASRLQRHLLALEASQQTYVKVQGLSLFNFLR